MLLIVMVHEASLALGTLLLAQFLMVRRYAGLFANVLQAGVSQYFIRFVPPAVSDTFYWLATVRRGFAFWFCHVLLLLPLAALFAGILSVSLFGEQAADARSPYLALLALSAALSLDYLARSLALAMQQVVWANVAELLGGSVLLICILPLWPDDLLHVFFIQSCVIGLLSIVLLLALWYRYPRLRLTNINHKVVGDAGQLDTTHTASDSLESQATIPSKRTAAAYAWSRNAGALSELLLTTTGLWMLRDDLVAAAAFALVVTLIKVVQLAATPVSQIMAISHAHRLDGNRDAGAMLAALLRVMALALPFAYACAEPLLLLWLSDPDLVADILACLPFALIGVLGYAISQIVKGTADVVVRLPFNLYSNGAAIVLQVVISSLLLQQGVDGAQAVVASLAAAFCLQGIASWTFARQKLKARFTRRDIAWLISLASVSLCAGLLTNGLFARHLMVPAALVVLFYAVLTASIVSRQIIRVRELTA